MDITIVALGVALVALIAAGFTYKAVKKLEDAPPIRLPASTDSYTKQEVDNMATGLTNEVEHTRTRAYELMERVRVVEDKLA